MDQISFFQRILAGKIRKIFSARKKSVIPFADVKELLLVINADEQTDIAQVQAVVKDLQNNGKSVRVVELTRNKNYQGNFEVVVYRTFLFIIKFLPVTSSDILTRHFDLVLGYSREFSLPLQYFVNMVDSSMIVLPFIDEPNFADISFKLKNNTLSHFVSQAIDFLNTIKK